MSMLQVSVYTADPGNVWAAKTSFRSTDPFAIVMAIQCSNDLPTSGAVFDQLVRMRDPREMGWYFPVPGYTQQGDSFVTILPWHSIDHAWIGVPFAWGTNFAAWQWWSRYIDALGAVSGSDKDNGIFSVQGTASVQGSDLLAASADFWYKVRP